MPIVIDNKPGASGTIGAAEVARATADGYTLLLSVGDPLVSAQATMKIPYDPVRDFRFISKVAASGPMLIASKTVKANNLAELIVEAKGAKTSLSYGSYGPGSFPQQILETLARETGIKLTEVPYRGSPPALQDLMAGQLDLTFTSAIQAAPLISEGRIKALAVIGDQRNAVLPKIETFAEVGFSSFVFRNKVWVGLSGPAALTDTVVQEMAAAVQAAAREPAFTKFLADTGFDLIANSPAQFLQDNRAELAVIPALIRKLGVTPQ